MDALEVLEEMINLQARSKLDFNPELKVHIYEDGMIHSRTCQNSPYMGPGDKKALPLQELFLRSASWHDCIGSATFEAFDKSTPFVTFSNILPSLRESESLDIIKESDDFEEILAALRKLIALDVTSGDFFKIPSNFRLFTILSINEELGLEVVELEAKLVGKLKDEFFGKLSAYPDCYEDSNVRMLSAWSGNLGGSILGNHRSWPGRSKASVNTYAYAKMVDTLLSAYLVDIIAKSSPFAEPFPSSQLCVIPAPLALELSTFGYGLINLVTLPEDFTAEDVETLATLASLHARNYFDSTSEIGSIRRILNSPVGRSETWPIFFEQALRSLQSL